MALPTVPVYTNLATFQLYTRGPYTTIADGVWRPHALHAEWIIDSIIGFIDKYDETQVRKFPTTDDDGNSYIPDDIQKAHVEITTWLLLKGSQDAAESEVRTTESWSSSGYSYSGVGSANRKQLLSEIPMLAAQILRRYITSSARLTY